MHAVAKRCSPAGPASPLPVATTFHVPAGCALAWATRGPAGAAIPLASRAERRSKAQRVHAAVPAFSITHGGYHFDGSSRRFFEGWYWKVTCPDTGDSFALIYSVEDPGNPTARSAGTGVQVMGPDGYICQFSRSTRVFWASSHQLELGAVFKARANSLPRNMVSTAEFSRVVETGFQASATLQQGAIIRDETAAPGDPLSTQQACSWCLDIVPGAGWGAPAGSPQRATAGWLSVLQVFEPHWQVLMSHGLATGWIQWGDRRYEFKDAPTYAEKNWGGGFPSKWTWLQCNTWEGQPGLSVTAVGARRALLLGAQGIGLGEEDVGLIGITLPGGELIELVPWTARVSWSVDPWGKWLFKAVGDKYEAVLEASCKDEGVTLRAPTLSGLVAFCKDSFSGSAQLKVWRRSGGITEPQPFLDTSTTTAAVEVGGGPWWTPWEAEADMKQPFRSLVKLPIDVGALGAWLPGPLKPPGL